MDVFELCGKLVGDCSEYTTSFTNTVDD